MKHSIILQLIVSLLLVKLCACYVPSKIVLGGLFPITGNSAGPERAAVFRLAIEQINNRSDILPNTEIVPITINTYKTEAGALQGSLDIVKANGTGIIGSSSSDESKVAAIVANVYNIPQISYASTDPSLSNKLQYPYFMRTVPPDSIQGVAIVNVIKDLGWSKIALLYSTSDYGSSIAQVVLEQAADADIQILTQTTFYENSLDLSSQMATIKSIDAHIIVLCCAGSDVPAVFRSASQAGLVGDRYVWFGSDAVVQETSFQYPNGTAQADVEVFMSGMIGTRPRAGFGTLFDEFRETWGSLSPVDYPGSGNPNVYNVYDPYIYDAVLSFAYAYQSFIDRDLWPLVITSNFTDALHSYLLTNTSFNGLTGLVKFDANGDREGVYDIVNLKKNNTFKFASVGTWSSSTKSNFTSNIIWYDGSTNKPQDSYITESSKSDSQVTTVIAVVVAVGGFVIIATIVANVIWLRYRAKKNKETILVPPDYQDIEFGDMKKSPNVSRSKLLLLLSMQDLLLKPDFANIVLNVSKADNRRNEVFRTLFYVYRANNKAVELISYFSDKEMSVSKNDTLFREDGLTTTLFRRYTRVVAMRYLWDTLAVVLNELKSTLKEKKGTNVVSQTSYDNESSFELRGINDSLSSSTSQMFEVDPSKVSSSEEEKISKLNLLLLAQKVFFEISRSVSRFPPELKYVLTILSKIHQRNFPDANPQTFIGVFVFLRLYCPAITAPHLYGIYEEPPESNVQRTLILLSKVLQNLANGILFGKKENYMVKLNEFITSNTDAMKKFVQELLIEDVVVDMEQETITYGKDTFEVIPVNVHHNSLSLLRDIVTEYRMEIFNGIQLKFDDTVMKQTKQQLDLIYSIQ